MFKSILTDFDKIVNIRNLTHL